MQAIIGRAKFFIALEAMAALLVCAFALTHWKSSGAGTFVLLLGLSIGTGAMKVVLPRVQGSLSASYLFLIWGIVRMDLGETLLMGLASSLVQCYWKPKRRPTPAQLLFNLSVICVSIGAGTAVFQPPLMQALISNQLFRMLLAALTYFAVNTLSVSGVIGITEGLSIGKVWRTSYLWSFPHYVFSASLIALVEYLKHALGIGVALLVMPPAYLIYHTFAIHITHLNEHLERAEQERRHAQETASLHLRTIRALALAIEAKDQTTGEHLHRVQTYAMGLAETLELPPADMEALRAAAILHDVGKIAVPEHIISKPGKLTPEEFTQMKIHTIVGAEIVISAQFPFAVAPLVRAHHEKWDGSGYPDGLKGEEIPLGARILTAVDCLDALASDRQYRKAMPLAKAMSIIVSESGKSFDPRVVDALRERCQELEALAKSTLPDNVTAFSIDANIARGAAPDAGFATGSGDSICALTPDEASREASLLNFINSQFGRRESVEADLAAIESQLQGLAPFDCLAFYRRRNKQLECTFARGDSASFLAGLQIQPGVGASGWTLSNRTPLMNGNAATEFGSAGPLQPGFTLNSSLSIPLESEFGPVGVLTLYCRKPNAFQTSHLRAVLAIGSKLAYQLNLESCAAVVARPSEITVGAQLAQLSEGMEANSATPVVTQAV